MFLYGEGRDVKGEILRTKEFFFFLVGVFGDSFAGFGGVWLDVFVGNLCLASKYKKMREKFMLVSCSCR